MEKEIKKSAHSVKKSASVERDTTEDISGLDGDNSKGKEINDNFTGRAMFLQWTILAAVLCFIFIAVLTGLHSNEGINVPLGNKIFRQTVPVMIEIYMHAIYISVDFAVSKGLSAYWGWCLCQNEGYSLIVCGFMQAPLFRKFDFASLLNFQSKYKKQISRASSLTFVNFLLLILTFFCSTAITIKTLRYDSGKLLCIEYGQRGLPIDRGWPTLESEIGAAEFMFGSALGSLSSEMAVENSTVITYPQLIDACTDGTIIKGDGLTTNLQTKCSCAISPSHSDLVYSGVPLSVVTEMRSRYDLLLGGPGWVNSLNYSADERMISITTMLSGNYLCGGNNYANKTVSICTTIINSHNFAKTKISWMNDGMNHRSTPNKVDLVEEYGPADMTWLYIALRNIFQGNISSEILPGYYPGTVSPILWWTTPNLQTISISYLKVGMETAMAMVVKAGITRTYSVYGTSCIQNVEDKGMTNLRISDNGFKIGLFFVLFEILLSVISIIWCIPWFLSVHPVLPGIRLVMERNYFNLMLCKNSTGNLLRMIGSTAERSDIWPKLDLEVRVGENIQTIQDTALGEIIVDKPKLVTNLSWDKKY